MEESKLETVNRFFICLSSKDRYDVVESIVYHLGNYGFAIWYDRHKMNFGENRNYKNFIEGIVQTKYAIVIMSENSIKSVCVGEEMEYIKKQYDDGKLTVFPIFYKIKPKSLPDKYKWLTSLVYKELNEKALTVINEKTGVIITVNQIINKVLKDELLHCKYKSLTSLHAYLSNHCNDKFVLKIIEDYLKINDSNLTARITLLYSLCIYIHTNNIDFNIEMFPQHFWKGFYRIFDYTRLSLNIDARETILLESEIIILLNKIYYDQ